MVTMFQLCFLGLIRDGKSEVRRTSLSEDILLVWYQVNVREPFQVFKAGMYIYYLTLKRVSKM